MPLPIVPPKASTTTEPLALHALEYMVRRFTGRLTPAQWPGLDATHDYPHVIGNSNFRHAEFLLGRYADCLDPVALRDAFFEALLWTLTSMPDAQRRRDLTRNAANCGLGDLLRDVEFVALTARGALDSANVAAHVAPFIARYGGVFQIGSGSATVAALLDIYYMRYHAILQRVAEGRGEELSRELLGAAGRRLIEPMPGYDVFVPLVKGWLGAEAERLYELLCAQLPRSASPAADSAAGRQSLARLGAHFARDPARLALVTASIAFEADTTMTEILRLVRQRVQSWPVSQECRQRVLAQMADLRSVFDGYVNASDACEHRLKPHRDLYSLAMAQMSIPRADYAACVGLEDTEPGIIALRAAGIGCAVALPNHDTAAQDYRAATALVRGGLPELILGHHALLAGVEGAA